MVELKLSGCNSQGQWFGLKRKPVSTWSIQGHLQSMDHTLPFHELTNTILHPQWLQCFPNKFHHFIRIHFWDFFLFFFFGKRGLFNQNTIFFAFKSPSCFFFSVNALRDPNLGSNFRKTGNSARQSFNWYIWIDPSASEWSHSVQLTTFITFRRHNEIGLSVACFDLIGSLCCCYHRRGQTGIASGDGRLRGRAWSCLQTVQLFQLKDRDSSHPEGTGIAGYAKDKLSFTTETKEEVHRLRRHQQNPDHIQHQWQLSWSLSRGLNSRSSTGKVLAINKYIHLKQFKKGTTKTYTFKAFLKWMIQQFFYTMQII